MGRVRLLLLSMALRLSAPVVIARSTEPLSNEFTSAIRFSRPIIADFLREPFAMSTVKPIQVTEKMIISEKSETDVQLSITAPVSEGRGLVEMITAVLYDNEMSTGTELRELFFSAVTDAILPPSKEGTDYLATMLPPNDTNESLSRLNETTFFNQTLSSPICVSKENGLTIRHLTVLCYCDELCELFLDCCKPMFACRGAVRFGTLNALTGEINVTRNNVMCKAQSTRDLKLPASQLWMVSSCPDSWPNDTVRDMCENSTETRDITRLLPVSDSVTHLTFQNGHCAQCHAAKSPVEWQAMATCRLGVPLDFMKSIVNQTNNADILERVHSEPSCALFFEAPPNISLRLCSPNGRKPVAKSRWDTDVDCHKDANPQHTALCSSGSQLMVVPGPQAFSRNIFCFLCRYPVSYKIQLNENCDKGYFHHHSKVFNPPGFTTLLNTRAMSNERCEPASNEVACANEQNPCPSPIASVLNIEFPLKISIKADRMDSIMPNCSAKVNVCTGSSPMLKLMSYFYTQTAALFKGEWKLLPQRLCSDDKSDTLPTESPATVAVVVRHVRLAKHLKQYREAVRMFENLQDRLVRTIGTKPKVVVVNGVKYWAEVMVRGAMKPCDSGEEEHMDDSVGGMRKNSSVAGSGSQHAKAITGSLMGHLCFTSAVFFALSI